MLITSNQGLSKPASSNDARRTSRGFGAPRATLRRATVLVIAALLATGCANRRQQQPESPPPPVAAPATQATPAPTASSSSAATLDAYKRENAARIYQTSAAQVYDGKPQALLRSVVVLSVTLDAAGNVAGLRTLRDNGDVETIRSAHDSVRNGVPYPRPPVGMLRGGRLEYSESWLFRDDGKFQLRSVADAWQQ